jgi:hypothetical protein
VIPRYTARKIALVIVVERPHQPDCEHAETVYPKEPESPKEMPPPRLGAIETGIVRNKQCQSWDTGLQGSRSLRGLRGQRALK